MVKNQKPSLTKNKSEFAFRTRCFHEILEHFSKFHTLFSRNWKLQITYEKFAKYVKVTYPKRRKNQTRTLANRNLLFKHDAFTKFLRFSLKFLQIQHITLTKVQAETTNYIRTFAKYVKITYPKRRQNQTHSLFLVTQCFHEMFEIFTQVSQNIQHINYKKKISRCDLSVMTSDLN